MPGRPGASMRAMAAVTPRTACVAAVALVAATAVLLVAGVAAALATLSRLGDAVSSGLSLLTFAAPIAVFSGVGAVIAWRRPGNPIGWLLGAVGALFSLVVAASGVSAWGLVTGSLPRDIAEWVSVPSSAWVIALGLAGTQLPLRLPNGELLSPRWRAFSRLSLGLIAAAFAGMTLQPGRVNGRPGTANPLAVEGAQTLAASFLLVIGCFAVAIASLVIRYRRAGAGDRAQLRWIAFGGMVFLAVYVASLVVPAVLGLREDGMPNTMIVGISQLAFAALPVAIGFAILRHRLYDIDVVIRRTLVYGALTATLAGVYVATVLVLQVLLGALTQGSSLAVATSTLAVAAAFRPARTRIQAAVDRRFFRRRYDAALTLERFGARMRREVELQALTAELLAVVDATVQPAHASLWVREPR